MMSYYSEKTKQKLIEEAEDFLSDQKNGLFDNLIEVRMQHKYIRGKLTRDKSPRYNTYVRSLTADLDVWMNSVEELLVVLVVELAKEREARGADQQ